MTSGEDEVIYCWNPYYSNQPVCKVQSSPWYFHENSRKFPDFISMSMEWSPLLEATLATISTSGKVSFLSIFIEVTIFP